MKHYISHDDTPARRSVSRNNVNRKIALAAIALTLTMASYVPVSSALIFDELSQAELAQIRGKFLPRGSSSLSYFGLSMRTTWGSPSRRNHYAGMGLRMNLTGSSPQISTHQWGTLGTEIGSDGYGVEAPLQHVSGSAQNVQVAGNDNTLLNEVELNVRGTGNTGNTAAAAGIVPSTVTTYQSDDGVVTQYVTTPSNIGYSVQTDHGNVIQQLGRNSLNNSQLLQSIVVAGNAQTILNQLRLDVGVVSPHLRQTAKHLIGNTALIGIR